LIRREDMKIVQNCQEAKAHPKLASDLSSGTVFKLVGDTATWLRTTIGCVNLVTNGFTATCPAGAVDLIYPNARVVLE
jgi:hypothetical protein